MLTLLTPFCSFVWRKVKAVFCLLMTLLCVVGFVVSFVPAGMMPNGGWNLPGRLLQWKDGWERLAWRCWEGGRDGDLH